VGTIGSVWQESTPSKETTGPAKCYENEQSEMSNGARAGFSQLVLVLDLSLRLLLLLAVNSYGAAFLQLSTTSSGESRWLNLQIQRSRRVIYANIATTADWLTPVFDLLRESRH